jgi:metal-responsive CopG/Arc/MetJ family transcriptional regulator
MAKSAKEKPKKRGRPATGKDPFVGVRLPAEMIEALNSRAAAEGVSRSEAIRRLIENGLTNPIPRKPKRLDAVSRAARHTDAQRAAHDYIDDALKDESEDVRAARKKRLTTMPAGLKRR